MITQNTALFTIFGATGDLAHRKLYPSLFRLYKKGFIKDNFAVIGTARREWSDEHFREVVLDSIKDLTEDKDDAASFAAHFYYIAHNVNDSEHYVKLKVLSESLDAKYSLSVNRIFYLAMSPEFFGIIAEKLKEQKLITEDGFNRLISEKPFGRDFESADALNTKLRKSFDENQIFRIDHYLGKEMVQNISAVRFSNMIFESLWNNKYIDNVQITLSETVGVEERGAYYDNNGALRDMVQNNILQIVALLVMEPPRSLQGEDIRSEKIKALRSLRLYNTAEEVNRNFIPAQYAGNPEKALQAYWEEPNVDPASSTETFVAGKILVDNFRWKGVPFYIRTGKHMASKETYIHIQFKHVSMNIFPIEGVDEIAEPNVLTIHVSPLEGFSLRLNAKRVSQGTEMKNIRMHHIYDEETQANSPEAYERLLLDCLNGDPTNFPHWDEVAPTNFPHWDEVAQSWHFVAEIRKVWDAQEDCTDTLFAYDSHSMGPNESETLLEQDGFRWTEFYWSQSYKEKQENE